jgi:hypothetical protein
MWLACQIVSELRLPWEHPQWVRTEDPCLTRTQYAGLHQIFAPLAAESSGFIAHIAGPTESGWFVTEVWESKSDHDSFVREQVLPRLPAGGPGPSVQEFYI